MLRRHKEWLGHYFEIEAIITFGKSDYGAAIMEMRSEQHHITACMFNNPCIVDGSDRVGDIIRGEYWIFRVSFND